MPSGIHAFIVPSQFAYDLLRPYLPHDASVYCVPNTIDVDKDLPVDVASNKTFLFMGRLTPEKGAVMFARAAALEHVPCRFVGEGMAKEEVARANSQATLSGWMSHREGLKALRSARALVFPSLWYEVQPLVVLEAAGSGVPSIVSDTCAARESVVDGVTGLYFRNGDESDLRAKITILKDPNVAARMGRAAYDRFWSSPGWSLDLHRQRLEATYRTILSPRHNIGAENDSSLVQLTTTNA
jgi:glycosyltransferase involved in cell wall biosynthesis